MPKVMASRTGRMTSETLRRLSEGSSNAAAESSTTTRLSACTSSCSSSSGSSASSSPALGEKASQAGSTRFSGSGSQTGSAAQRREAEPSGSSETAPTNGYYRSSLPSTIQRESLSTLSRWTLTEVGFRLYLGWTEGEIALHLGIPRRVVKHRLEKLREEIEQQ